MDLAPAIARPREIGPRLRRCVRVVGNIGCKPRRRARKANDQCVSRCLGCVGQLARRLHGIEPLHDLIEARQAIADQRGRHDLCTGPHFGQHVLGGVDRTRHRGEIDDTRAALERVEGAKRAVEPRPVLRMESPAPADRRSRCSTCSRDSRRNCSMNSFIAHSRQRRHMRRELLAGHRLDQIEIGACGARRREVLRRRLGAR